MLTGLQPQGTVDYNLEEEENQKEDWSILGLGGFVAEVLAGKWYQFNCQLNIFYSNIDLLWQSSLQIFCE